MTGARIRFDLNCKCVVFIKKVCLETASHHSTRVSII